MIVQNMATYEFDLINSGDDFQLKSVHKLVRILCRKNHVPFCISMKPIGGGECNNNIHISRPWGGRGSAQTVKVI